MPKPWAYALGGVAILGTVAASGAGLILAGMLVDSINDADRLIGLVMGAVALLLIALPITGVVCIARTRHTLGTVLCGVSLAITVGLLLLLPGAIEAAARP